MSDDKPKADPVDASEIDWGGGAEKPKYTPISKEEDLDWADAMRKFSVGFKPVKPRPGANGNGHRSEMIDAHLEVTDMDSIVVKPVRYVWQDRLAFGKPTIIAGDPGGGKSTLACDIVSRASRSLTWPDGATGCRPCRSLILAAEDAPDDTIKPRLVAMGGDMKMIGVANMLKAGEKERLVQLGDVQPIAQALRQFNASILVIDPVTAYLGGADSHKDSDVRGLLSPLMKMAEELDVAVLAIMHLSKGGNRPALYRIGGSIGFTGVARTVFGVVIDPESSDRRYFVSIKNNLAPEQQTLAFRLNDNGIRWEHAPALGVRADQLMNAQQSEPADQGDADALIAQLLSDDDWPMSARKVQQAATAFGVNRMTLNRAAKRAGIVIRAKHGTDGKLDGWYWFAPDEPDHTLPSEKCDLVSTGEKSNVSPDHTRSQCDLVGEQDLPVFNPRLAFLPPDPSR